MAKSLGKIFKNFELVKCGHVVEAQRGDLVGATSRETAQNVEQQILGLEVILTYINLRMAGIVDISCGLTLRVILSSNERFGGSRLLHFL